MFKLKRIELLGFKSFADRTRLDFGEGTVAIVGPNGCGKSNLSDAISWVLGEQSARLLRGDRMADVIFNGTGARLPTGRAEVSLTLADPDATQAGCETRDAEIAAGASEPVNEGMSSPGLRPASRENGGAGHRPAFEHPDGEIVVTRRLFRSGESDYCMNGEACRLRDIQELFMGTGLGPDSYALIEQGRIGQILSSRPSERRAIIEEAAGVSKFRTRKRLAEAKLESSRQNLARVTDILEEVTRQVNLLKRQASKARRCGELSEELKERLKVVLSSKLLALETECDRLRQSLASIRQACAAAMQELESVEQEQKNVGGRHEELERELARWRQEMAGADLERERLASRAEQARQQAAVLEGRVADAVAERETLTARLATIAEEIRQVAGRAQAVREEGNAAGREAASLVTRQGELARRLTEAEERVETCRRGTLAAVECGSSLRNQLVQAEDAAVALERQVARTAMEQAAAEEEQGRAAAELEAVRGEQARSETRRADLARAVSEAATALDQARQDATSLRARAEALRQDFAQVTARCQALEESLAGHAYSAESVRRLLAGSPPSNGQGFRALGVLADFVEVSPGYEELVEGFLKSELDCVVVERHEEAQQGIALLRGEGSGRSTFFVTRLPSNRHENGDAKAEIRHSPGVLTSVQEIVRFAARLGLNGDLALPALARAYVVEDRATAERLAAQYPTAHFLTPQGEHYHHRLVSGGKGAGLGPLGLRRDLRELERRAAEREEGVQRAEEAGRAATARLERLETERRSLESSRVEAEKDAVLGTERLRQAQECCRRAAERRSVLEGELTALATERQAVENRRRALGVELEAAAADQERRQAAIAEAVASVRLARVELDGIARALAEAQARAAALGERLQSVEAEGSRLEASSDEVRARLERLATQSEGWAAELRRLEQERAELGARAAELEARHDSLRQTSEGREGELRAVGIRRDELAPAVDQARARLEAAREKRAEVEVALARADSDRAHHAEQCRGDLGVDPAVLLAEAGPTALEGEALAAAAEELRAVKTRLENLGPINMAALEELQEAEGRYAFLETQRQDLLASLADTAEAIRETDRVSRRLFLEAFHAINQYFAGCFRTLMGGGTAEMRLTDESDAESGVDLVVQPPGKRLQNVLLLSGGEKALTALALLMGVFRFTPSPFCVLDEVDAPLDDANVERFTRLIREMTDQTQFVLITHNKRTMEICPVMYGVTMQEPGVSKLVSVKFGAEEAKAVAATA